MNYAKPKLNLKQFFLNVFFLYFFLSHIIRFSIYFNSVGATFDNIPYLVYKYFHATIVYWLLFLYLKFDGKNKILNYLGKSIFTFSFFTLTYMVIGACLNLPFHIVTGVDWQYEAPITWNILFILSFAICKYKKVNTFLSLNIAMNMIFAGGFIYEAFCYGYTIYGHFIHEVYVFLIEPSFLSLFTLAYFLKRANFKPHLSMILVIAFTIISSYLFMLNIPHPRLLTSLSLIWISMKIPDNKK